MMYRNKIFTILEKYRTSSSILEDEKDYIVDWLEKITYDEFCLILEGAYSNGVEDGSEYGWDEAIRENGY